MSRSQPGDEAATVGGVTTITDVAREAGVSKTTVSYVISRNPRIPEATANRVREAMNRLGYTVNYAARALSTAKTMTIGLLINEADGLSLSLTRGAYLCKLSDYARAQGYDLLLMNNRNGVSAIRDVVSARKVDGLILMDVLREDPRVAAARETGIPTVLLGVPSDSCGLDQVDTDFGRAAHELVDLFARQGHREVAVVHTAEVPEETGANYAVRFRQALLEETADKGLVLDVPPADEWDLDPGEKLRAVLTRFPRATGVIVDDDNSVISAPQVLMELGVAVPRDLSVAVVAPDVVRTTMRIPYTAIDINLPAVAERTVETLMRRIADPSGPAVTQLVSQPLTDLGSVAAVQA